MLRNYLLRWLLALLVGSIAAFLGACTSMISGNQPIPVKATDRLKLEKAMELPSKAPLLSARLDGRPVRIYKVAFDGTLNNRARIPESERETIVAHIADLVHAQGYYEGVGTHGDDIDIVDAVTGGSCVKTAEEAKEKFLIQARKWLEDDPTAEIRIFVTGFSRGAATARHFINIVTRGWNHGFNEKNAQVQFAPPRFYVLLYDTVATGQRDKLDLTLPSTVEYAVHFVAEDEPRSLWFSPTIDLDLTPLPVKSTSLGPGLAPPKRLNTVFLPGAHSDIGTSYQEGLGALYIVLTEQFLYMLGLTRTNCWDVREDPLVSGKHDSRGPLDKLFGSRDPNSVKDVNRPLLLEYMEPLSPNEIDETAKRLKELWYANADRMASLYTTIGNQMTVRGIHLRRNDQEVEAVTASDDIAPGSITLSKLNDARLLEFRFAVGNAQAKIVLKPQVLNRIRAEGSIVSMTYLQSLDKFSVAIFVDDELADFIPMEKGTEVRFFPYRNHCVKQKDGSWKSPIYAIIMHSNGTVSIPYDDSAVE